MKTVKLEIDVDMAKGVLADFERKISERIRTRDEMSAEILRLEQQVKSVRSQMQSSGASGRAGLGNNLKRIRDYLSNLPENKGARMVEIGKATGIGTSSIAFTLKGNPSVFVADDKIWKLK